LSATHRRPPQVPKASDLVYAELRKQLLSQRPEAGERLASEAELVETYAVGRITIREALRLLERDGLVSVKRGPTGGVFAERPDISRISDAIAIMFSQKRTTLGEFVNFRRLVEPTVARLAAENISDEQRELLLATTAEPVDGQYQPPDLHAVIGACTGNSVFQIVQQALNGPLAWNYRTYEIDRASLDATRKAHIVIVQRILEGDADGAESAMAKHLNAYATYLQKAGLSETEVVA